jgi:hypothetical protein
VTGIGRGFHRGSPAYDEVGLVIDWATRVPNGACRLSWGISDRVGTSGRSESLLESAVPGGAILLEVRWTADAQLSNSVN